MKRTIASVVITILLLALAGGSSAQKRTAPEAGIREADQQWLKVFAAKDLENSAMFCTDDASVLAPNAPIATGHPAIKKLFSGFFALPDLKISWQPVRAEVSKSGDMGYTSGAYQMTFKDPSGKLITDKGKYVTVWKKQADGSWKVLLDIFNTDLAMS